MHWLRLPEPRRDIAPAFDNPESARAWLDAQASTSPLVLLSTILEQIQAIDGTVTSPSEAVALLDLLRSAAVAVQSKVEGQFTRKALPMAADEELAFEITQQVWMRFGIAYLRLVPESTPANRCLQLHRAASALRLAHYCHYLAARSCTRLSDHLLLMVLTLAEANGVLRRPMADPDFLEHGKGTVSGQLAWAILMRIIDPFHLAAIELPVVNRLFSRWRELVDLRPEPDRSKGPYFLDLASLFGDDLTTGTPRYLNLSAVALKLGQRIKLLAAGESPEALKLGRTLSSAAASRLLNDLEQYLQPLHKQVLTKDQEIELVFGGEDTYAVVKNRILNPTGAQKSEQPLAYERKAIFGLEQSSRLSNTESRLRVASEHWTVVDGVATRVPQSDATRRLAPCLIGTLIDGEPRIGVMASLQCHDNGALSARLKWFDDEVEACSLKRLAPRGNTLFRVPAFVLRHKWGISLILPADAGARLGIKLGLADCSVEELIPAEVMLRGTDFVHYACTLGR